MVVLIDNGHGRETPGKQSPDGRLKEYEKAREIAYLVVRSLRESGVDAHLLVPEYTDTKLRERVRRANGYCAKHGAKDVLLVSIHHNAAGADGRWHSARGFSAHVSLNASARSKALAKLLWDEAAEHSLLGNRSVPKEGWIAQDLCICRDTQCAAVLTENLFQDNEDDVAYLLSGEGVQQVADMHVAAIKRYIAAYG